MTFVVGCDICRGNVVTFVVGCDICRGLLWHLSGAVTFSGIVTFVGTTIAEPPGAAWEQPPPASSSIRPAVS